MHGNVQAATRSFASNTFDWFRFNVLRLGQRINQLLKSAKLKRRFTTREGLHKVLPPAAIVAGAAACAFWLNSGAAGVFALILLFLFLSIGKSLERIAGLLKTQSAGVIQPNWRILNQGTTSQRDIYVSNKAIERLQPWVEDKSSLTEESAKAYCSVLLDTLAILHPRMAGRAKAEDS